MAEHSERSVLSVHAPEGTEYATNDGILRLDEFLSYRGEAGVVRDSNTGLPLRAKDGSWQIWVGRKENVHSTKLFLSQIFGLSIEDMEDS